MNWKPSTGDLFVLSASIIWSWFPFISKFLGQTINPILLVGLSNLIAAITLGIFLGYKKQLFSPNYKKAGKDIALTVFFIAILAYILLFSAAKYTAPNTMSILNLSQILWGFLILGLMKFESFSFTGILGSLGMIFGAYLILANDALAFHWANLFVIGANALFVFGNIFQRRAREHVTSIQLICIRSAIAGVILTTWGIVQDPLVILNIGRIEWGVLFLLGFGIFAIEKILWVEGIHRNPITRCNVLAALAPAFTMMWSIFVWNDFPTWSQWIGFGLMLIGGWSIILRKEGFLVLRK